MKIYTKKGDEGKTSLFGGNRVLKSDLRIESYGSIDELNSFVGLLRDQPIADVYKSTLISIQNELFTIGSHLATVKKESIANLPVINELAITFLEKEMDVMDEQLEPLTAFILPGGHIAVSYCHVARCVCRRAERAVVRLVGEEDEINALIIPYLNRLSDYFFMLSRSLSKHFGAEEIKWEPRKS